MRFCFAVFVCVFCVLVVFVVLCDSVLLCVCCSLCVFVYDCRVNVVNVLVTLLHVVVHQLVVVSHCSGIFVDVVDVMCRRVCFLC